MNEMLTFYAAPGIYTDPGELSPMLAGLPTTLPELVHVVQGALIHIFWAERYGRGLSEVDKTAVTIRPVSDKLALMAQANPAGLALARPLEQRQVGNCRDFSVLLCTLLRHQGVPARARCGFGVYFMPEHYEDHWVCEVWDRDQRRWRMVDAQLDVLQQRALEIDFDPLDMPPGKFFPAGQAYQMCRQGQADPEKFGIFEMHGLDFIQGNVVRDFLAMNKVEILPWDWGWGYLTEASFADLSLFDHLAGLLNGGDQVFAELRSVYESNPALGVPPA